MKTLSKQLAFGILFSIVSLITCTSCSESTEVITEESGYPEWLFSAVLEMRRPTPTGANPYVDPTISYFNIDGETYYLLQDHLGSDLDKMFVLYTSNGQQIEYGSDQYSSIMDARKDAKQHTIQLAK